MTHQPVLWITWLAALCAGVLPGTAQPVSSNSPANQLINVIELPPGHSLIANPSYHNRGARLIDSVPDNSVGELFKQMPNGTTLLKYDNDSQRFIRKNVFRHGKWTHPNDTLVPGEGALIFIPGRQSVAVTFTGNCHYNGSVAVPAGLSLISSPDCGTINFAPLVWPPPGGGPPAPPAGWDNLSFDPQEGDVVFTFDNTTQRFQSHTFTNGAWDVMPDVGVGESCFVQTSQPRVIRYTTPPPL